MLDFKNLKPLATLLNVPGLAFDLEVEYIYWSETGEHWKPTEKIEDCWPIIRYLVEIEKLEIGFCHDCTHIEGIYEGGPFDLEAIVRYAIENLLEVE
jgi:hypothetical protein